VSKKCFNKIRMLDFQKFTDDMQTPTTKLTVKELREREEFWRALWSWLDDDVKYLILRIGQQVRVMRRDYKGSLGELGQAKFSLKEIELTVYEKFYNYNDGKYYFEDKTLKIPSGAITWLEFVSKSELVEEVDRYEVESIPETSEVS